MPGSFSLKRVGFGLWLALFPALYVLLQWPINSLRIRCGILLAITGILLGSLLLSWARKRVFFALLSGFLLVGAWLFLPVPWPKDVAALRKVYAAKLRSFEACPYIWGGEGRQGIDCSGLVRRGLQDALMSEGLRQCNPTLIRAGIWLWWNDDTAESMGNGYGGETLLVTECKSLNDLNHDVLRAGDMAVTTSGLHVMGYLGDQVWIGADPGEMKVTVFPIPEMKNGYFASSMKIMRWKMLDDASPSTDVQ